MNKRSREQRRANRQQQHDRSNGTDIAAASFTGQAIPAFHAGMLGTPELVADVTGFSVTQSVTQTWSGPVPDPSTLAKFNEIEPGMASRIVKMAEDEGSHARATETRIVNAAIASEIIGQLFALIIVLAGFTYAYKLAMGGHDWVAGIIGGATLVSLAGMFLKRSKSEGKAEDKDTTPSQTQKITKKQNGAR